MRSVTSLFIIFNPYSGFQHHFLHNCLSRTSCLQSLKTSLVLCGNNWLLTFCLNRLKSLKSLKQLPNGQTISKVSKCSFGCLCSCEFFFSSLFQSHCFVRLQRKYRQTTAFNICCLTRSFDIFIIPKQYFIISRDHIFFALHSSRLPF